MTSVNNKSRHIKFNEVHEEILKDIVDNVPGINSISEAVRYSILSMAGKADTQKEANATKRKLNVLSNQVDILVEMVAGGFHKLDVKSIGYPEESYVYQDAVKHVDNKKRRATTISSNYKKNDHLNNIERDEKKEYDTSRNFF